MGDMPPAPPGRQPQRTRITVPMAAARRAVRALRLASWLPPLVAAVGAAAVGSCSWLTVQEGATGALVLKMPGTDAMQPQILVPDLEMQIASFDVVGDGPAGAGFAVSASVDAPAVTEQELTPGNWQITVDARNADGSRIGFGSVEVTVIGGQTTIAEVFVQPLAGNGSLTVTVAWPSGVVAAPQVSGTLDGGGGLEEPASFAAAGTTARYDRTGLDSGYYVLTVQLRDGSSLLWGGAEVVRILAGETTTGSYVLNEDDINPVGSVAVEVLPDMQPPLQVQLSGGQTPLALGSSMTVIASVIEAPGSVAYRWYLDGERLEGQTAASVTVGAGLAEGNHRVDMIAFAGATANAASYSFQVSRYAKTPVVFVHGYGMSAASFATMIEYLQIEAGYPAPLLRAIELTPRDGSNVAAAELQIAPAVEQFLADVGAYLSSNQPQIPLPSRVDLVAHSMGALSARWYAARVAPQRVATWLSLAGANHGSDELCGRSGAGASESCPAFAATVEESQLQLDLNGASITATATDSAPAARAAGNVTDETPYGIGVDAPGIAQVAPDALRRITYLSLRTGPDTWITPDSSPILDGAGGVAIPALAGVPLTETSPGNLRLDSGVGHDQMLVDSGALAVVEALLAL